MAKRKPKPPSLHDQLQGPVETPPTDYRHMASIASAQRDDALKALNRRANVEKLFRAFDDALARLEETITRVRRLEHQLGERLERLGVALKDDAE